MTNPDEPINVRRILPIIDELLADSHGGNIFWIIDRVRYYCPNASLLRCDRSDVVVIIGVLALFTALLEITSGIGLHTQP